MESESSSSDSDLHAFGDDDQRRDLMAFAGYPAIVSFDEASHMWKVPQQGSTSSLDLNTGFKSMVRVVSSSSSPFHSPSMTPDPPANFIPPTNLQAPSWMPTEGIVPPFDPYGSAYDDGTLYRGAYIPTEREAENQWGTFLLDAGTFHGSPHDSFR